MSRIWQHPGLLVVFVTAMLAETLRVSFPLLYDFAESIGFTTAAGVIPLLFATTFLAGPLGALVGPRTLLVVSVGGLAVARLVMQVQATPGLAVTMAGVVLGFVALPAALRVAVLRNGSGAASAIFLGLALDTAIRVALTTWDAAWRHDAFSWVVGIALPLGTAIVVTGVFRRHGTVSGLGADSWTLAVLPGPLLALQTLVLASPGFVASSGHIDLPAAGAVILAGLALAAAVPAARGLLVWAAAIAVVAVAAAFTGPTGVTGWLVPIGVLIGQASVGALTAGAAGRAAVTAPGRSAWRTGVGAGIAAIVLVGSLLPYQISYELPLGLPQFVFPAFAAVVLVVVAGFTPRARTTADDDARGARTRRVAAVAPVPLLLAPFWSALTWPEVMQSDGDGGELRVATYNIHSSVDWFGRLDPEQIARVLEDGEAEVMMLQEVARGWPLAGGLDSAAWLSRRLGAEFAYGTAADHQFGNAVLSTRPVLDSWSATMDKGDGTMQRGYVGATVTVNGTSLDVWSVHLQHQDHTGPTRQAQARQLLTEWDGRVRTVIGGDLNSRPGSDDIQPWFDGTDLISAQDTAGDPAWNTSPALDPDHRIDWILGTPDLTFTDAAVPHTLASDHLPVFATLQVR